MNLAEYNNIKNLTYREYCAYLQNKYGKPVANYMTVNYNKIAKNSRTAEGLYCHHIFEDMAIKLSEKEFAQKNPFEWQLAENLCYCDLLEHLFLHILICEKPNSNHNITEITGLGGVINFMIPELNDVYSGFKSRATWQQNCHNLILNNKDVYLELVKRFKNLKKYAPYNERIYTSLNETFGIWKREYNSELYKQLKAL